MYHIHEKTDTVITVLDDNDNPLFIDRSHFEQWLLDAGKDIITERNKSMQIDWYEFTTREDRHCDIKEYVRVFGRDIMITEIAARQYIS